MCICGFREKLGLCKFVFLCKFGPVQIWRCVNFLCKFGLRVNLMSCKFGSRVNSVMCKFGSQVNLFMCKFGSRVKCENVNLGWRPL